MRGVDGRAQRRRRRSRIRDNLAGARAQRITPLRRTTAGSPRAWSARWCDRAPDGGFAKSRASGDRFSQRPRHGRAERAAPSCSTARSSSAACGPVTGRREEYDGLEYTLYRLARRASSAARSSSRRLHLTDGVMESVAISATKLGNRQEEERGDARRHRRAANFPTEMDAVTLPALPAFLHLSRGAAGAARRSSRNLAPPPFRVPAPRSDHLSEGTEKGKGPRTPDPARSADT